MPTTPADRTGANVGCFPVRAAFPVSQAGRRPRFPFRGLLRLTARYGLPACSPGFPQTLSRGFRLASYPAKPLVSFHAYRQLHQNFHFDPGTGTVYTTPLRTTRLSQAEHCASPSPVAASASSHRSQTLIERVEPRSGRACSLQNGFEPKAVDPRPVKATRSAAAAPRSCVACQRTAAGSDAPPPAATSSSGHA